MLRLLQKQNWNEKEGKVPVSERRIQRKEKKRGTAEQLIIKVIQESGKMFSL